MRIPLMPNRNWRGTWMDFTIRQKLNDLLKDQQAYVLITCEDPSESGEMAVEMSFKGDPVLASYLVNTAQSQIDLDLFAEEDSKIEGLI